MHIILLVSALSTIVLGVALPEPNPAADPGLIINVPTVVPSGLPPDDIYIYFDLDPLTSQLGKSTEAAQIAAGAFWLPDGGATSEATATSPPEAASSATAPASSA